ncbi:MAG: CNNM domain-containing protein, partial [Rhodobacteraceae bacterium]|nr:CNNM domain-containing protein [Paracoccaceae bacterium]
MTHLEVLAGTNFDLQAFIWLNAGAIIVLIIFSALFSGSETALTSASRGKLKTQAEKGNKGAQRALKITDDRETLISSVLVGNNLVNILATALATNLFTLLFGDSGVLITTIVMTMVVLIFAEVLPKTYAIARPEEASQKASRFILPFIFIFTPIVVVIKTLVTAFLRLLGLLEPRSESLEDVQDEIKGRIELEIPTGMFDKEDQRRVLGALDISSLSVEDVMRHRSEIDMLNADDPIEEILAQCMTTPHSRLPVYKDETENIIKIAHVKDLYRNYWGQNEKIETSTPPGEHWYTNLKEPYFVIETTPLGILMQEFLEKRTHFALVVDEYGALQGLVTLEDIIEE